MKGFLLVLALLVAVFGLSTGNAVACDAQTLGVCNGVIGGGVNYLVQPQVAQAVYAQPVIQQQVYASPVVQQVVAYPVRQQVVLQQNVGHHHRQNVVVQQQKVVRQNVVVKQRQPIIGRNRASVVVGY